MAFNTPLEAEVPTLYDDIKGLPTVADGILVPNVAAAVAMRWLRPDGSLASPDEIAAEWYRVQSMQKAMAWWKYQSPTGLHLGPDELERVTLARFDDDIAILTKTFPALLSWPWQAIAGAMSMAWAMGPGFPASWLLWSSAARNMAWMSCAADCEIRWKDNPGVRPRDFAQQALFLMAAGDTPDEARRSWPAGPAADAAGKALDAIAG